MPLQRLNPYSASFSFGELNGWRACTLKLIRVCEVYCGRCDEIEPQRLGDNIWNGGLFVQEQAFKPA